MTLLLILFLFSFLFFVLAVRTFPNREPPPIPTVLAAIDGFKDDPIRETVTESWKIEQDSILEREPIGNRGDCG